MDLFPALQPGEILFRYQPAATLLTQVKYPGEKKTSEVLGGELCQLGYLRPTWSSPVVSGPCSVDGSADGLD